LEFISIELDDPFGEDANDLDVLGMSESVINDIRLFLIEIDGEGADSLLGEKLECNEPRSWTGERIHETTNLLSVMKSKQKKYQRSASGPGSDNLELYFNRKSSIESSAMKSSSGRGPVVNLIKRFKKRDELSPKNSEGAGGGAGEAEANQL
jgi:hypothetical protein